MEGDFTIAWGGVLGSDRRLSRQVEAASAVVYGRVREGRRLAILAVEDSQRDGSWVVNGARALAAEEALQVRWLLGGAV